MKVFISWSGAQSRGVALALRDWLPNVIQAIDPYVSSEDIDKGARWSSDISAELESSEFGILCITAENLHAPWVSFEAGALSKSLEQARVSPFLYGIERTQVTGPLLQFQSTINERDDVLKLVRSINKSAGAAGLDEGRLDSIFDVWWPQLAQALAECGTLKDVVTEPVRNREDLVSEILELAREQQRILRNPEALIPIEYLAQAIDMLNDRDRGIPLGLIRELREASEAIRAIATGATESNSERRVDELVEYARMVSHAAEYLFDLTRGSRHRPRRLPRESPPA